MGNQKQFFHDVLVNQQTFKDWILVGDDWEISWDDNMGDKLEDIKQWGDYFGRSIGEIYYEEFWDER